MGYATRETGMSFGNLISLSLWSNPQRYSRGKNNPGSGWETVPDGERYGERTRYLHEKFIIPSTFGDPWILQCVEFGQFIRRCLSSINRLKI